MNDLTIDLELIDDYKNSFSKDSDIYEIVKCWFEENGVDDPPEYLINSAVSGLKEEGYLQKERNC